MKTFIMLAVHISAVYYSQNTNNTVLFSLEEEKLAYQRKIANFRSGTLSFFMNNLISDRTALTQAKLKTKWSEQHLKAPPRVDTSHFLTIAYLGS